MAKGYNIKVQDIKIKDIDVVENHRINVNETNLNELMQSIKEHGLEQPIGVAKHGEKYNLIFGHRRMLAFQKLGYETIPATVAEKTEEKKLLLLNITENLQRKDPSYVEFGRAIEKLSKMNMNEKEISIRLGIPEDKVKMILTTYTRLPEKHRNKVEFMGKGSSTKGKIPAQTAMSVLRLKKDHQLTQKNTDDLFELIKDDKFGKEDIKNLGILLNSGVKFEDAYEKLHDYFVYRIDIVANKYDIVKAMEKENLPSAQLLFKRIIYGKAPAIKKPDFIKV